MMSFECMEGGVKVVKYIVCRVGIRHIQHEALCVRFILVGEMQVQ